MPVNRDLTYVYDGSLEGMLCCIFEAFVLRERPVAIEAEDTLAPTLYEQRQIGTDPARAARVVRGLGQKVSRQAAGVVQCLYLSCRPGRELLALDFTRAAFRCGPQVTRHLGDAAVAQAVLTARQVFGEAHQYKGLLRFSDLGGALAAEIAPKNQVLPLLAAHFSARLRNERFLIYDRTHRQALIWQRGSLQLVQAESYTPPPPTVEEQQARQLWRQFYRTIAIEARVNPALRRSNMPKWYWALLTELQEEAGAAGPVLPAAPTGDGDPAGAAAPAGAKAPQSAAAQTEARPL